MFSVSRTIVAIFCISSIGFPAWAQPPISSSENATIQSYWMNNTENRLARLEQLLNGQAILDQEQQQVTLQREIKTLRGEMEVLAHKIEQLEKQQHEIYRDLSQRLDTLVKESASSTGSEITIGSDDAETSTESSTPVDNAFSPPPEVSTSTPNEEEERQAYQDAYGLVKIRQYEEAVNAFNNFLLRYPQSRYTDNIQYWIGESYYAQQKFEVALVAFNTLLEKYPSSAKYPHALLKIGYIYHEQKNSAKAREVLTKVKKSYPDTAIARLAEERLRKIQQE